MFNGKRNGKGNGMSKNFYRSHKQYLEASIREWRIQVDRTDENITKAQRESCEKLLHRAVIELEMLDVDIEEEEDDEEEEEEEETGEVG